MRKCVTSVAFLDAGWLNPSGFLFLIEIRKGEGVGHAFESVKAGLSACCLLAFFSIDYNILDSETVLKQYLHMEAG